MTSNQQKMPPKKALATLRQIVKGQPLARRNPNDPGHKAMDDAEDALDVLRSSVEQLEAERSKVEVLQHIVDGYPNLEEQFDAAKTAIMEMEGHAFAQEVDGMTHLCVPISHWPLHLIDQWTSFPARSPKQGLEENARKVRSWPSYLRTRSSASRAAKEPE